MRPRFSGISGMAVHVARAAQSWAAKFREKTTPLPADRGVRIKQRPYLRPRDGFLSMALSPRQQSLVWRRHRQRVRGASRTLHPSELLNRFGKPHMNTRPQVRQITVDLRRKLQAGA